MARKNVLIYKLATDQPLGGDFISPPTLVKYLDNCAYQINATTDDAVGTFAVEASLDYAIDETTNLVTNTGTWVPLDLGGTPALVGATDQILINLNQLPFNAIRVRYSSTSGDGVADIYIMARQIGG